MAEALRKNIYIPQEDAEFFKGCESYAQQNNIPMSNMILKSLKKYMENVKNSIITLVIKKNENNTTLSEYKKIQFKGKKIINTDLILNKGNTPKCGCITPKVEMKENDVLAHEYTFYKTNKGKLMIYIKRFHLEEEYDYNGNIDYSTIEEESDYKIFNDIKETMEVLCDIPYEYIDNLILEVAETEFLDI